MHTPSAALAWEFWRRHRQRVIIIVGIVLGFALMYPKLCAMAGLNLAGADPLTEFARSAALQSRDGLSLLRIGQVLYILSLTCGPEVTLLATLLCVIWMFTFTGFDQKTKDPLRFPARLFTLPVSTSFLLWRLFLGGLAAIVMLYVAWVSLIPRPYIEVFGKHQNCLGWITLLAVTQAIVWGLAAWPTTRMLVLTAVVFYFLGCIDWYDFFELPIVLPVSAALAYTGLQKMRHGQWQGWNWQRVFLKLIACMEWRGPKRFASPAQAQVWFEWRRFAGNLCFMTAAMALVPVVIRLLARVMPGVGPLSGDAMGGFTVYLVAVPLFVYFCHGASPQRSDQSFLMARPLTSGGMVLPMLKTAAISSALSWVAVLAAFSAMSLLGDFRAVTQSLPPLSCKVAIVIGLIFLTWRMAVVNLCFMLPGSRWIASIPSLAIVALSLGIIPLKVLEQNDSYWRLFLGLLPLLLQGLVAVKILLAFLGFGIALKRRLLTPDNVVNYLTVWVLVVVVLLATLFLTHPPRQWIFSLSLGIVLFVPLARISFCPVALARYRHA